MTVDELLTRITSRELTEWQYVLDKEKEIGNAVRQGIDPEVATQIAFERKDDE